MNLQQADMEQLQTFANTNIWTDESLLAMSAVLLNTV
jgi:hypothetical protein